MSITLGCKAIKISRLDLLDNAKIYQMQM